MRKLPQGIEIRAPARLHLGLIGMGDGGPRINGGLGFAIDRPGLIVTARAASRISVTDLRSHRLGEPEQETLQAMLVEVMSKEHLDVAANITLGGDTASHFGFGAGTAIRLACLEALLGLNGRAAEPAKLVHLSRRGGASGVGIRTYFEGGMVFDLGRRGSGGHKPSYACTTIEAPLPLARTDMPRWQIGLCIPNDIPSLTHEQEAVVFREAAPVPMSEVNATLTVSLMGVFAAAVEGDLDTFISSMDELQLRAWKRAEWGAYGPKLRQLAAQLRDAGARGVALTSMGPSLFFCANEFDRARLPMLVRRQIRLCYPMNTGRRVRMDNLVSD